MNRREAIVSALLGITAAIAGLLTGSRQAVAKPDSVFPLISYMPAEPYANWATRIHPECFGLDEDELLDPETMIAKKGDGVLLAWNHRKSRWEVITMYVCPGEGDD